MLVIYVIRDDAKKERTKILEEEEEKRKSRHREELLETRKLEDLRMQADHLKSLVQLEKENLEKVISEIDNKEALLQSIIDDAKKDARDAAVELGKDLNNAFEGLKGKIAKKESELSILEDRLELAEMGLYEPSFDFETAEQYKQELLNVREVQKELLKRKGPSGAIYCGIDWVVGGSRAKGKKMTNEAMKLALRAFNGECSAAIANCKWNNVLVMESRINKSFSDINKMNDTNRVVITNDYLNQKIKELYLTHEYEEKKQKEKEEQAEIRKQMQEEIKLECEIRKAKEKAEKEGAQFAKALEKARKEAQEASGLLLSTLNDKILELEAQLADAEARKERAKSMAEQTKRGHVYVISNIGSFGEGVFKVGMTRRLDPSERIKELSGASVPFPFDVHAMIFSEDAPRLEKELHKALDAGRLNKVNVRKEFFRTTISEIKEEVARMGIPNIKFTETAVAKAYRESAATSTKPKEFFGSTKKEQHIS